MGRLENTGGHILYLLTGKILKKKNVFYVFISVDQNRHVVSTDTTIFYSFCKLNTRIIIAWQNYILQIFINVFSPTGGPIEWHLRSVRHILIQINSAA